MEWLTESLPTTAAILASMAALAVAFLRNETKDRSAELAMIQNFIDRSKEDQSKSDKYHEKYIEVLKKLHQVEMQLAQGRSEADRLVEQLTQQKELRMTEADSYRVQMDKLKDSNSKWSAKVEALVNENKALRKQLSDLIAKHDALQLRVEQVESRADRNEKQLQAERKRSQAIEAERDAIAAERDALAKKVESLQVEVDKLKAQLKPSNEDNNT